MGRWIEEEGIPTTQISLVREHTAAIRPPRALWVPFMLGRPLGAPGDAPFQRRVVAAALSLLEKSAGPVLEDYPEEAPVPADVDGGEFACPVSFSRPVVAQGLAGALQREVAELAPWYDLAVRKHGRTTASLSGLAPAAMAQFIADFIANQATPVYRQDLAMALALRLVTQDLKAYYLEAVAVQPGARAAQAAREWFWRETAAGQAFFQLRDACLQQMDEAVKGFGARSLIPLAIAPRPDGYQKK